MRFRKRFCVSVEAVAGTEYDQTGEGGVSWASLGGVGRLLCYVRASPKPTFTWKGQSGLILLNSDKYTIHEPKVSLHLCFSQKSKVKNCPVDSRKGSSN